MQIGNRAKLDAERAATLKAFDDVWTVPRSVWDVRSRRALRCAQRFASDNTQHLIGSWGGFIVAPSGNIVGRFIVRETGRC